MSDPTMVSPPLAEPLSVGASKPLASIALTYRGRYCTGTEVQIVCDVYQRPKGFAVHTICPRCLGAQWIDSARKAIEFHPATGALYIEAFECTWELGPDRREFGVGLCRSRVVVTGREVRDA